MYSRVVEILTRKFEICVDRITPATTLDDLDLDSLDAVELYIALQKELGIELEHILAAVDISVQALADEVYALFTATGRSTTGTD